MEWRDEGIVLRVRPTGESAAVVDLMTAAHGRHAGLVRSARSRRMQPVLQPGNTVDCVWRARLDEQLGLYRIEPLVSRAAALMESAVASFAAATLTAHMARLPERDPHPALYQLFALVMDHVSDPALAGPLLVRFELAFLEEQGFGLDLVRCAVTGAEEGLTHVSPRTGRAVCRQAAEPWLDRLLPLPRFLTDSGMNRPPDADDVAEGLRLTGHFLRLHMAGERDEGLPEARSLFLSALRRAEAAGGGPGRGDF